MPFKSIHPSNHPELASLLLDQCQAELCQSPWKNMMYLRDGISCPSSTPSLSTDFSAHQVKLRKSIHLVHLSWTYLLLPFGKFSNRTCDLYANFMALSFLLAWFIVLKAEICFPWSHRIFPHLKVPSQLRGKNTCLNIVTRAKRSITLKSSLTPFDWYYLKIQGFLDF